MRRNPAAALAIVVVVLLIGIAIAAPLLASFDPYQTVGRRLQPPGGVSYLGTDQLGRDVASRIIYGTRITLYVSLVSVGISALIGAAWGITAAYFHGTWDLVSARVMDILGALPTIVMALALMSGLGASLNNVIFALVVVFTPQMARVIRSSALGVCTRQFVEAARSVGANDARIVLRHVAPNTMGTLIVLFSVNLGTAAILEASLSFLGAGADPATPSWGGMLTRGASTLVLSAPWVALFPGLALCVTVMAFNLLGDAIRDEFDPRLRDR